jgi:hypothetical protein
MAPFCRAILRYICLLDGGDLARGIGEGKESSIRCSRGMVDLVQFLCVPGLVPEDSDQLKTGSTATTSALGRWSLEACELRCSTT